MRNKANDGRPFDPRGGECGEMVGLVVVLGSNSEFAAVPFIHPGLSLVAAIGASSKVEFDVHKMSRRPRFVISGSQKGSPSSSCLGISGLHYTECSFLGRVFVKAGNMISDGIYGRSHDHGCQLGKLDMRA